MFRRDYVIKLIERFGLTLRQLRDRLLKRQGDQAAAQHELEEIAREAGFDLGIARQLDPATLLMWLNPVGEIDPPRFWLMAELLYLAGLAGRAAEAAGWQADMRRAAALFGQLEADWRPDDDQASAGERLAEIQGLYSAP